MKRATRVLAASAGVAGVGLALATLAIERTLGLGFQGIDDANIFLRYSRNLVQGHGFSYNPSDGGVQGFTSELWLVCCAYAELFGQYRATALLLLSGVLTATCFSALVLVTFRAARRLGASRSAAGIVAPAALVVATHPSWFAWNVLSLMDAALYAFSLVFAWTALESFRQRRAGAPRALAWAAVFLVIVRPEGPAWLALLAASVFLIGHFAARSRAEIRAATACVLTAGGTSLLALLAWRWATFGALLPNTVYAKVSLPWYERIEGGIEYFSSYARQEWAPLGAAAFLSLAGWLAWSRTEPKRREPRDGRRRAFVVSGLVVPWIWLAVGWALPVLAGGDAFGGHRFYQALVLLLIPPSVLGATLVLARLPRVMAVGLVSAAVAVVAGSIPFEWSAFFRNNRRNGVIDDISRHIASVYWIARDDRRHGERIAEFFSGGSSATGGSTRAVTALPRIAYAAAGGISVGYPGVVFDMMGLNDPVLARGCGNKRGPLGHACFDRDHFFRLSPDILLPRATPKSGPIDLRGLDRELNRPGNWDNTIFRGLFSDPEFRKRYRLVRLFRRGSEWAVHGYFRTDFLLPLLGLDTFEVSVP